MKQVYAFCYFMDFDPQRLKNLIPAHIAYWERVAPEEFSDGPFNDHSGGLILFSADSLDEAGEICRNDPYIKEGLARDYWIREWLVSHRR